MSAKNAAVKTMFIPLKQSSFAAPHQTAPISPPTSGRHGSAKLIYALSQNREGAGIALNMHSDI